MRTPKYRRHSVRDVGFVEIEKRRIYLPGKFGSNESKLAYRKEVAKHFGRLGQYAAPMSAKMTVADLTVEFLDTRVEAATSTYALYKTVAKHWLELFGDLPVLNLRPTSVHAFVAHLEQSGMKSSSIRCYVSRLIRMLSWGVSRELVHPDVLTALSSVRVSDVLEKKSNSNSKRTAIAESDFVATLPFIPERIRPIVQFQWWTGCRAHMACELRKSEIDTTVDPWAWRPGHHKTAWKGIELELWIGPRAQAVIRPVMETARDILFPTINDRPMSANFYIKAVKKAVDAAVKDGAIAKPWTSHQLRYSRSTYLAAEHGLEAAQATLGHTSIATTQIYSSRLSAVARRVASEEG